MASLDRLPVDLCLYIMDYLTRDYRAANSLVKTSRTWHDTALPLAYHHAHIDESIPMFKLVQMMDQRNPALRYIKHVTVISKPSRETRGKISHHLDRIVMVLASTLPQNTPQSFN